MKTKKSDLISIYAQSIGIEAAKKLISRKINAAVLENKKSYTEEEIVKICAELLREGGLVRVVTQNFFVQMERWKSEEQTLLLDNIENQIWYLTDKKTYGIVNKAHAEFLGIEKGALESRNIYNLFSKKEAGAFIRGNQKVFRNKKQSLSEIW
ncbi:hypothetical protein KAU11_02970, partial [Candidatus Babeliales bacterium]|nr:hypothetical protein [Candidatus Babeliales bacterium]